ncbi:hypothetical protein B1806_11255 [Metallibacterium scheffleri]|uniref:Uncharacterized protein n=1 Tax=Metallibacterium scheffleri TaxID=993689 RepID=A0A4V3UT55_9GAMM|nr:hypothetical protein B1806_11255 [Metallibacterium scheffleri]
MSPAITGAGPSGQFFARDFRGRGTRGLVTAFMRHLQRVRWPICADDLGHGVPEQPFPYGRLDG